MRGSVPKLPGKPEGPAGPFYVFHHVYAKGAPTMYRTDAISVRGAFACFRDDKGDDLMLSGNLTIRPVRPHA